MQTMLWLLAISESPSNTRVRVLQGGLDFQTLLEQHPDAVMEYIVQHGTKLLGKFKCKVLSLSLPMPCPAPHVHAHTLCCA